jgi:hypothetical protein
LRVDVIEPAAYSMVELSARDRHSRVDANDWPVADPALASWGSDVRVYAGGKKHWTEAGLPVEQGSPVTAIRNVEATLPGPRRALWPQFISGGSKGPAEACVQASRVRDGRAQSLSRRFPPAVVTDDSRHVKSPYWRGDTSP